MKLISISTGAPQSIFGDREALRLLSESGFDGADFLLNRHEALSLPEEEMIRYFSELRTYADSIDLRIFMTHGLLAGYGRDEEQNKLTFENARRQLIASGILGAEYCVLHSARAYQWGYDADIKDVQDANFRLYTALIPTAEETGVSLCLESLGRTKVNEVIGPEFHADPALLIADHDVLPTEKKGICLDTDHCICVMDYDYPDPAETVRLFGSRLKALHLCDSDGRANYHTRPGSGIIDWPALFRALDEAGYSGVYNFELNLPKDDSLENTIRGLGSYLREFVSRY